MAQYDTYFRRLNRYGTSYQERLQNKREENFERQLDSSIYRVQFTYDGFVQEGELTKKAQDETENTAYLLTRLSLDMPGGTIISVPDKNGKNVNWMVYWLENMQASGYNRYILLRMTHLINWYHEGTWQEIPAYMYGQEDNMLKNEIKSRSRMDTIYAENTKLSFFVCPHRSTMHKDDYFELETNGTKEAYRITGMDIQSTAGVAYVTVDPIHQYDFSSPKINKEDEESDVFWLKGGVD